MSTRLAAMAALLLLSACHAHNPLALHPISHLQSDFNRASPQTRILLLISPT